MWRKSVIAGLALVTASTMSLARPQDDEEFLEKRLEIMTERLELEPAQTEELRHILESQHQAMQQLHAESESRIRSILTSEQEEKLTQMREQRKDRREAFMRNRQRDWEEGDQRCPVHDRKYDKRGRQGS